MKIFVLIGISVFVFFGCGGSGGSGGSGDSQYKTGDNVVIVKNIQKSLVPTFKTYLKNRFEEQFNSLSIELKFKDYESENCLSFGFRLEDVKTTSDLVETKFIKNDNTTCVIQDHYIGNVAVRGNSGLVIFIRRP